MSEKCLHKSLLDILYIPVMMKLLRIPVSSGDNDPNYTMPNTARRLPDVVFIIHLVVFVQIYR